MEKPEEIFYELEFTCNSSHFQCRMYKTWTLKVYLEWKMGNGNVEVETILKNFVVVGNWYFSCDDMPYRYHYRVLAFLKKLVLRVLTKAFL